MRKLLTFHVKHFACDIAHAAKENAKRRHANHLIPKGFRSILAQFGAIVLLAQIGALGARRNNGLELYIGERPFPVVRSFAATHMNAPAYSRRAGEIITCRGPG